MRPSALLLLSPLTLLLACEQRGTDTYDSAEAEGPELVPLGFSPPKQGLAGSRMATAGGDADGDGSLDANDCDDANAAVYPGAAEADNLTDDDCDGWVDEDFVAAGDVVVTEINRQSRFGGAGIQNNGSWVEVYNTSDRTVDLASWVLSRGASAPYNAVTLDPASAPVLAPGDYAVFCDTDDYVGSGAAYPLTCDYVWGDETQPSTYVGTYRDNTFALRRDADAVALYLNGSRTTGTLIDQARWYYDATNGYWPRVSQFSMSLDPAYLNDTQNDDIRVWCATTANSSGAITYTNTYRWYDTLSVSRDEYGTPGAANYNCPVDPDLDGDGVTGATDCDDTDAGIYPGATETCDGVDQDCDGSIDDGVGPTWYADTDGDSFGDAASTVLACSLPSGYVADTTDCDDTDAGAYPGAVETCDGIDEDCDGTIDEGGISGTNVFFADTDGDGFGDPDVTTASCLVPGGYAEVDGDCDDATAGTNPDATELDNLVDEDCDDLVDETFVTAGDIVFTEINRQSRFGAAAINNDGSWVEVYNASARTLDLSGWTFVRGISSGFNSITLDPAEAPLLAPGDYAVFCDTPSYEGSAAAYALTCDYVWGDLAEAASYVGTYHDNTLYLRRDTDQVALYIEGSRTTGRLVDSVKWTYDATNGYWPRDATFSTSLDPRTLDGTDNDALGNWCSTSSSAAGVVSRSSTWAWYDVSASIYDEFGTPGAANYDCLDDNDLDADGADYTVDCNEADATIRPGATEVCDGVDQDCDGAIDDSAIDGATFYADTDGDGYGNAASTTSACSASAGWVADATDCDDTTTATNPGAAEVCDDGIDNDCDPDPSVCEWTGSQTVKYEYDFRAYGTAANYAVGTSIANNGDFDGDGYDDVVVGQAFYDISPYTDNGAVHLWYGPVDSSDALGTADLLVTGANTLSSDQFGWATRFVGDVDGDGTDDLVSSSWKADTTDAGRAYLFLGGTSPTSITDAFATFSTTTSSSYAGSVVDGADVDGDGRGDVLVAAYGRTSSSGGVGLWRAGDIGGGAEDLATNASLFITHPTVGGALGYGAALVPDLDGDGLPDLVAGAPAISGASSPGAAYVFYGLDALSGTVASSAADATITGTTNGDRFGLAVAGLGDVDGDGQNDLAVTADRADLSATDAGAAYVFTTPPTGSVAAATASSILTGGAAADYFGRSVAGVGDVNGDGLAELFVGATGYDDGAFAGAGAVYLVYGPPTAGTSSANAYDFRMTGANTADAVGYAVTGGGDVNGDGLADYMTSSTSWDGFGYLNAGGSWLYYGRGE